MQFKDDYYVNIAGWMCTKLRLKGNDLLVYAAIYGFSQKDGQWFTGGQEYLAELCCTTTRCIRRNLANLEKRGLIEVSFVEGDARLNRYRAKKIEDNMSGNYQLKEDNMSGIEHKMSGIEKSIEDNMSGNESEKRTKCPVNRGQYVPQNINIYNNKYKSNNNTLENKNKNKKNNNDDRAREGEFYPLDELTNEQVEEIIAAWNRNDSTIRISEIDRMGARGNNTRLCIGKVGFDEFILEISKVDQQAYFRKRKKMGKPVTFDWFVKPDNFIKTIEGNYSDERKKTGKSKVNEWEGS